MQFPPLCFFNPKIASLDISCVPLDRSWSLVLELTGLIQEPVESAKHSHNERFKLITIKYSELEAQIKTIYLS